MPSRTSVIIAICNISCILCKPFLPNFYVEPMQSLTFLIQNEVKFDILDRYLINGDDSGEIDFDALSPSFGVNYQFDDGI